MTQIKSRNADAILPTQPGVQVVHHHPALDGYLDDLLEKATDPSSGVERGGEPFPPNESSQRVHILVGPYGNVTGPSYSHFYPTHPLLRKSRASLFDNLASERFYIF